MMDANKRESLVAIGYTIGPCCGMCVYAELTRGSDWGTCDKWTYDHLKHGETRQLSVNRHGSCSEFRGDPDRADQLEGFREFYDDRKGQ